MTTPNLSYAVIDALDELHFITRRLVFLEILLAGDIPAMPSGEHFTATLEALRRDLERVTTALDQARRYKEVGE